jgi:hypothetical protein
MAISAIRKKNAVIVSTYRDDDQVLANLLYISNLANGNTEVIISNCNPSSKKRGLLDDISEANPYVRVINHNEKVPLYNDISNIVLNRCVDNDYISIVADDDSFTLGYISEAIETMSRNANVVCSYGHYLILLSDGRVFSDSRSAHQSSPYERVLNGFNPNYFNTMFFASFRRSAILPWALFCHGHPMAAVFFDFIHCISLMMQGEILTHTKGYYLWTAENWDNPDANVKTRGRHYDTVGLNQDFAVFHDLHFAVEAVNFILGKYSPVQDDAERDKCAEIVWQRCMKRFVATFDSIRFDALVQKEYNEKIRSLVQNLISLKDYKSKDRVYFFAELVEHFSPSLAMAYRKYLG